MPISATSARVLSAQQRQYLIRHVDGPVPVNAAQDSQTRDSLIARGLLRGDRPNRPKETSLTQDGRYALGVVLGDAADALVAAGILDMEVASRVAALLDGRAQPRTKVGNNHHLGVD